jgi:hypothetical protein
MFAMFGLGMQEILLLLILGGMFIVAPLLVIFIVIKANQKPRESEHRDDRPRDDSTH